MATKFTEMRKRIEILEQLDEELDRILKNALYSYEVVKETETDEQATNWRGELLWNEDGTPKKRVNREYDHVLIPRDQLSEEALLTEELVKEFKQKLLKLI